MSITIHCRPCGDRGHLHVQSDLREVTMVKSTHASCLLTVELLAPDFKYVASAAAYIKALSQPSFWVVTEHRGVEPLSKAVSQPLSLPAARRRTSVKLRCPACRRRCSVARCDAAMQYTQLLVGENAVPPPEVAASEARLHQKPFLAGLERFNPAFNTDDAATRSTASTEFAGPEVFGHG